MKTKNLFYLTFSFFILLFASCSDDDNSANIKEDGLPTDARAFLEKYLPQNKFISAQKHKYDATDLYEVNLSGKVLASFDTEGNWNLVESQQGLPETIKPLISENSQKELKEKYGNTKITRLSNYKNGELYIELDNNKMFNDIYSHEGYALAQRLNIEDISTIPQKMKAFINKFSKLDVKSTATTRSTDILKYTGFRGTIYRLLCTDKAFVEFYEDGEWFYMKNVKTRGVIQDMFIEAVPQDILTTLMHKQSDAIPLLKAITRFNNKKIYGFDLSDNTFIAIDAENKLIEPPLDKAKEYIKKAFNPQKELQYEVRSNTSSPYFLRYAFIVTGQGSISLVTDVEGNMRNLSAGPVNSSGEGTVSLPNAVFEMLPSAIKKYLDANHSDKPISSISHSYSTSQDDIPLEINVLVLIPNNLKTLIFDRQTGEYLREYNVFVED